MACSKLTTVMPSSGRVAVWGAEVAAELVAEVVVLGLLGVSDCMPRYSSREVMVTLRT